MTLEGQLKLVQEFSTTLSSCDDTLQTDRVLGEIINACMDARGLIDEIWRNNRKILTAVKPKPQPTLEDLI